MRCGGKMFRALMAANWPLHDRVETTSSRSLERGLIFGGAVVLSCLCLTESTRGQTLPSAQDLSRIQEQVIRQDQQANDRLQRAKQPDRPNVGGGVSSAGTEAVALPRAKNQPCFKLHDVKISGYEPIGPAPIGWDRLNGKCATVTDLGNLLNDLNVAYQKDGWITTRAYFPKQTLNSGRLEIVVVPGRVSSFNDGTGKPTDRRVESAFPNGPEDLLNLRDLEQGLENFNGVPSQSAKFQLYPGELPGTSVVRLVEQTTKPWRVGASVDNSGVLSTGVYKVKATAAIDNIFNINDLLSFSASTNLDRASNLPSRLYPLQLSDGKSSDTVSLSYKFPVGNWSFFVAADASRYFFITPGNSQDYNVRGGSWSVSAGLERLLYRDQISKLYMFGDVTAKRGNNYIVGYEIESQRRELTIGQLGLRGVRYLPADAELTWSVGGKVSLPILGAQPPISLAVAEHFSAATGNIQIKAPIPETTFQYSVSLSGQWSEQELPPTEQFSIGGRGTVRGFQEDTMYGNRGGFIRNELSRPVVELPQLKATAYGALDAGVVVFPSTRSWSRDGVSGTAVGVRGRALTYLDFDVTYAQALRRPSEFKGKRDLLYFSLSATY